MTTLAKQPPSATADKFLMRFNQDGLRKELKVRAAQNERTLNAEVLYLIKRGLEMEQKTKASHEKDAASMANSALDRHSQESAQ